MQTHVLSRKGIAASLACCLALAAAPLFAQGTVRHAKPVRATTQPSNAAAPHARLPVHDHSRRYPGDGPIATPSGTPADRSAAGLVNRAPRAPRRAISKAPAGSVSAPTLPAGAIQVGSSFEGVDFNGSDCGCLPPDPGAAVGNNYVVETVNTHIRVFDKSTGSILFDQSLQAFFGAPSGGDPYVVYDDVADRWYVTAFNSDDSGLFLAVSKTGNPLDGFLPSYELTNVGGLPDYAKVGFNKDAIFISYNDFGSGDPIGVATIASVDKAAAFSGTLIYYVSVPKFQFRAMPPAQMHGDTTGGVEWFLSTDGSEESGNTMRVTRMENYLSNSPSFTYTSLAVTPYQAAFLVDQPGGQVEIPRVDITTTQVQYHGGHLVSATASGLATDGFTYPKGLYYQVDVSGATPTLLREGVIDPGPGVAVLEPSVDEDAAGNLGLTWMETSSSEYLSMWVGVVDAGGTLAASVAAPGGGFFYRSERIGDYSTTVLDPTDRLTFWSANEYIGGDGDTDIWRTHITSFTLGMSVSVTAPANGDLVAAPPVAYVVRFSSPYDPNSVDTAGLLVNGISATSFSLVNNLTISFGFAVDPVTGQGLQHFDVAAGTVRRLWDGEPVAAYRSTFRYDAVRMQVAATMPAGGSVATLPLTSLVVNLNEPYDPASVSASDVTLSVGSVQSFQLVNSTTINYVLAGVTDEGTLSFSLAAGALTDAYGNPSLPYQASVLLDYATQPFPVPAVATRPAGGLIYETSLQGHVFPAGDTDGFTIATDPGQTITVVVEPVDQTLAPAITLAAADGTIVASAAAGPNQDAVIQTYHAPGLLWTPAAPQAYTVTVGGGGGSAGQYRVRLVLNAAVEMEEFGAPPNDSLAQAQSIEGSFVSLGTAAPKADRGAVLGRARAAVQPGDVFVSVRSFSLVGGSVVHYNPAGDLVQTITSSEFDSGFLSDVELGPGNVIYVALTTDDFSGATVKGEIVKFDLDGRLLGVIPLPDDPTNNYYFYPFGFDVAPDGTLWIPQPNSGRLLHVDAAGQVLASYAIGVNPEDAAVAPGGAVYVSDPALTKVLRLDPATGNVTDFVPSLALPILLNATADGGAWVGDFYDALRFDSAGQLAQQVSGVDLAVDAQQDPSGDLWTSGNTVVKYDATGTFVFQRTPDGFPVGVAVVGTDSTDPLPAPTRDYYSFQLKAGQSASVALAALTGSSVSVQLQDAAGAVLAQGSASTAADSVIQDFVATTTGTYYVAVFGDATYSVVVTRNAAFDGIGHGSAATALPLIAPSSSGAHTALGEVEAPAADFYRVELAGNKTVKIETVTPGTGAGEFVNSLDPMIWLFDASGHLVAQDDNSSSNGRDAKLSYKVPASGGGTYYIAVGPSLATPQPTRGEYILSQVQQ